MLPSLGFKQWRQFIARNFATHNIVTTNKTVIQVFVSATKTFVVVVVVAVVVVVVVFVLVVVVVVVVVVVAVVG